MAEMKYDLLIRDGEVVDPDGGLRGHMDVGIAGGKIVEVAPSLAEGDARKTISAAGRLVTPGLVDVHAHLFINSSDMGEHTVDPDVATAPICGQHRGSHG